MFRMKYFFGILGAKSMHTKVDGIFLNLVHPLTNFGFEEGDSCGRIPPPSP